MVSLEQVNRFTLGRQGLLRPFKAEAVEIVGKLGGLQAQTVATPPQALWARTGEEVEATVVNRALYEERSANCSARASPDS